MSTDRDAGDLELDTVCGTPENPTSEPLQSSDHHQTHEQELDPVLLWVPSGRRLISGLVGLNVVLLGTALVISENFNPEGLSHQEPEVFLLVLMGISLIWMFWYLLWARRHPDISPHRDHHAGGVPVIRKFPCSIFKADCSQGVLGFSNSAFMSQWLSCSLRPSACCCLSSGSVI